MMLIPARLRVWGVLMMAEWRKRGTEERQLGTVSKVPLWVVQCLSIWFIYSQLRHRSDSSGLPLTACTTFVFESIAVWPVEPWGLQFGTWLLRSTFICSRAVWGSMSLWLLFTFCWTLMTHFYETLPKDGVQIHVISDVTLSYCVFLSHKVSVSYLLFLYFSCLQLNLNITIV